MALIKSLVQILGLLSMVALVVTAQSDDIHAEWHADENKPTTLPCAIPPEDPDYNTCQWTVKNMDINKTMMMSDISSGMYPGYSHPTGTTRNCDLKIDNVSMKHYGTYNCTLINDTCTNDCPLPGANIALDLIVNILGSTPKLTIDGRKFANASTLPFTFDFDRPYAFKCVMEGSFPAPAIRWRKNGYDVTENSTTNSHIENHGSYTTYTTVSNVIMWFEDVKGSHKVSCDVYHKTLTTPVITFVTENAATTSVKPATTTVMVILMALVFKHGTDSSV